MAVALICDGGERPQLLVLSIDRNEWEDPDVAMLISFGAPAVLVLLA